jgi:hypothetical protein
MEIQTFGMISSVDEFELQLRAAGGSKPVEFKSEEIVYAAPSTTAVRSQVRLMEDAEPSFLDPKPDSWVMMHEVQVLIDKDDVCRICSIDRVKLQGNAQAVLTSLGFKEEFRIGRYGKRVALPNGWQVEYFSLYEPKVSENATDMQRNIFVLEKGNGSSQGLLVVIRKQFTGEEQVQLNIAEAWKVIRRLIPVLQVAACASLFQK